MPPTPTQPAIGSPVPGYTNPTRWAGRTLTVASLGGDYQDAQAAAMFEPFAAVTGVQVQQALVGDLGELRQQVENGQVTWDVVDIPTEDVVPLARADYLTPIDYQQVDRTPLFDEIILQHGVGAAFFSTVIVHLAAANPSPVGWSDFWDVAAFPGGRTLRGRAVGTLEFALIADGVAPAADALYPLDIDRAFASLERLRPHVVQWYENQRQPVALLLDGAVTMASSFSARVAGADDAAGVAIQWRGGMLAADSWVVPRGAANVDIAMDFINFATRAITTANFSRVQPFGPVNRGAFELLREDRYAAMPNTPERVPQQFVQNWAWWADHRDDLETRFRDWRLNAPDPTAEASGRENP